MWSRPFVIIWLYFEIVWPFYAKISSATLYFIYLPGPAAHRTAPHRPQRQRRIGLGILLCVAASVIHSVSHRCTGRRSVRIFNCVLRFFNTDWRDLDLTGHHQPPPTFYTPMTNSWIFKMSTAAVVVISDEERAEWREHFSQVRLTTSLHNVQKWRISTRCDKFGGKMGKFELTKGQFWTKYGHKMCKVGHKMDKFGHNLD